MQPGLHGAIIEEVVLFGLIFFFLKTSTLVSFSIFCLSVIVSIRSDSRDYNTPGEGVNVLVGWLVINRRDDPSHSNTSITSLLLQHQKKKKDKDKDKQARTYREFKAVRGSNAPEGNAVSWLPYSSL